MARAVGLVGDPWVIMILHEALRGTTRFESFRRKLDIADSVLSKRLRLMVEAGLLERLPYRAAQRRHHEYVPSRESRELLPLIRALMIWGEHHASAPARGAAIEQCGACRHERHAHDTRHGPRGASLDGPRPT